MIRFLASIVALIVLMPRASAAQADSLQPLLDRAFEYFHAAANSPYAANTTRWMPGDRVVYRPETGAARGGFVVIDAKTGRQRTIIGAAALAERTGGSPASLSWAIAQDSQRILLRGPSGGWTLSIADGTLTPADTTDPATRAMRMPQARPAPTGGMLAVPRDSGGFAVLDPAGRTILERAGEARYGWKLPGEAWSPDGKLLAVWRNDASGVHAIPIVDYRSAVERVDMIPYVKTGTPLVRSELYLVDPIGNQARRVELPGGEAYYFLAGWRPDGSEALVLSLSRDAKRLDLLAVRVRDGTVRRVMREERPESFVAGLEFSFSTSRWQVTPLPDNHRFIWISERDGWRHLYLYDFSGGFIRQVTHGRFPVQRLVRVAPDGKSVFLLAATDSLAPYDLSLYRQNLSGGPLRRLTPEPGLHAVSLSPSARYFTDLHGNRSQPARLVARSVDGRASTPIAGGDSDPLRAAGFEPPESLSVVVDRTRLYGVLFKPADFDPARRYPVIDYIYAGPFISVVPWDYSGNIFSWEAGALAQMGFVVMLLDARGTPNRDKAFQDYNYGRIGQTEIGDHVAALRQAAATRPYMDTSRVGIYGHSWGGYFALRGMLTAPEMFKAGYAGAPGALEEDAFVNEPNMGLLETNPAGYRAGSNPALAANLRGVLRIMHGTSDIDASLSSTMRMAAALIAADKHFELLIMPGQPHGPIGPARRYYTDDVRRFFVRVLGRPR